MILKKIRPHNGIEDKNVSETERSAARSGQGFSHGARTEAPWNGFPELPERNRLGYWNDRRLNKINEYQYLNRK